MTDKQKRKKTPASDLVIVQKSKFPVLEKYPLDGIGEVYRRVEKLACWFLLRTPIKEISCLANPSCINMFCSSCDPKKGSRTQNRAFFDEQFLLPFGLDCTKFEFVYLRKGMKLNLANLDLSSNGADAFDSLDERAALFIGRKENGEEDSCIESVCRHIRNAFAHGRIAVLLRGTDAYIFLEDGNKPQKVEYEGEEKPEGSLLEIRMRMIVKLDTLEAWYRILVESIDQPNVIDSVQE
ncbi:MULTISPECIES: hypothetical protein [unclassified Adlercreutzia]|uniref:hypothetical protein n=1 Tax=unclassified Adlercreutzia TaxID=2636013 RepID=UPI0013ED1C6B|nr:MULTISPECIES: hypothetical protein [unclassified Adlercreutzia]